MDPRVIIGYGSVRGADGELFAAYRRGDELVDLTLLDPELFGSGTLDTLLAAGPAAWARIDEAARDAPTTRSIDEVHARLPFTISDYTDFYASRHHATNAGRIFRPNGEPLPANWLHVPVGYHGRSATVTVSGEPVRRPAGVLSPELFATTRKLDFEAEVGFVVGVGGHDIPVADADDHVFGVCLLDDWSARDIQAFETVPLGPFLGKSFATSVAAWITPLSALADARRPHEQDPQPLPHLRDTTHRLALDLEIRLGDTVIGRPRFTDMHWTYAQLLAHLTSNGARVRPGDLYASGTVSGASDTELGCLLEITANGVRPVPALPSRTWLEDGDTVTISANAGDVELAPVTARIEAAGMEP